MAGIHGNPDHRTSARARAGYGVGEGRAGAGESWEVGFAWAKWSLRVGRVSGKRQEAISHAGGLERTSVPLLVSEPEVSLQARAWSPASAGGKSGARFGSGGAAVGQRMDREAGCNRGEESREDRGRGRAARSRDSGEAGGGSREARGETRGPRARGPGGVADVAR